MRVERDVKASPYPSEGATLALWTDERTYESGWPQRARHAASMLRGERWVCDLGCGMQSLRTIVPPGTIYLPADLKKWTADTALCELNKEEYPTKYLLMCDLCFILGVIEYICRPERLFEELAKRVESVILSYNIFSSGSDDRLKYWANSLSIDDLRGKAYAFASGEINML
jgi:hypothetical protein